MDTRLDIVLGHCISGNLDCCTHRQGPVEKDRQGMTRQLFSTGSPFEQVAGYSRAVVQGDWCFVSGCTGYNYKTMEIPKGVEDQTRNTLANVDAALDQAGFARRDIVRARYIITDPSYADIVFPVLGAYFHDIRPAATMIVAQLVKPEMKIEIEVTALRQ